MWLKEIWIFSLLACYLSTTGSVVEKYLGLKINGGSFWKWHIAREWGSESCKTQRDCVLWHHQTQAAQQVCVFFFLFALLFSLNLEPAFKASCFGHANKEFPFSCQVRLISWLNQKASRTQFCWNFCFCDLRDFKFTQIIWIQVGDPTVVEIRVSWNCHLLSASDDASSYVLCLDALLV